jgi:isoaspartyl peptidase/L-asparaginase-like protein (Ntn-hydrolase superfamily)
MQTPFILLNGEVRDEILVAGVASLRRGARAADVAEQVARDVEDDADEHSVGYSGLPNILGEVELDAAFMDGASLAAGAVGGLKGYRHPISVARQVMERLPHVLLVGDGAARFAGEIGAERGDLLTDAARDIWLKRVAAVASEAELANLQSPVSSPHLPLIDLVKRTLAYREGGDTMNVMVRDGSGHLAVAVTTSGIAWKYPGRVGDSPVVGAGLYADDRHGAAACMGLGEITIRQGSALRAVLLMQMGMSLEEAGRAVVRDMLPLCVEAAKGWTPAAGPFPQTAWVRMLMIDRDGRAGAYCTHADSKYKVQTVDEAQPRTLVSVRVEA